MITYQIVYGYNSSLVSVDEPTTDYGSIVDILIDQLELDHSSDCGLFIKHSELARYNDDEYVVGGNYGRALYHGGNFRIEEVKNN